MVAPDRTVIDGEVITIGNVDFRVHQFGPARTDSDLMVEIVGENILFTADVVRNGLQGLMEDDSSFSGSVATIDTIAQRGFKLYIPGHSPPGGPEVFEIYCYYISILRDTFQSLYEQGFADFEMKQQVLEAVATYRG